MGTNGTSTAASHAEGMGLIPGDQKPYLGGYRHKITGQVYHHAAVQTTLPFIISNKPKVTKYTRETQTVQEVTRSQQTPTHTGTQCDQPGIYHSMANDRMIRSHCYETAETKVSRITHQVIILQKYWRGYKARKAVLRMRQERHRQEIQKMLKEKWLGNDSPRGNSIHQTLFEEKLQTRYDFEKFYNQLENWKQEQLAEIDALMVGSMKQTAICKIVQQEAQFLALLDQHKQIANRQKREKTIDILLNQMTRPQYWQRADGKVIEVETPAVATLKSLQKLYYDLQSKSHNKTFVEDRVEKLNRLRTLIKDGGIEIPKLTEEIIRLTDREVELLARRSSVANYSALRHRLRLLLLQYIFVYYLQHNQKSKPSTSWTMPEKSTTINRCQSCGQYRPVNCFTVLGIAHLMGKCRNCQDLDNAARRRQEIELYRRFLRSLRKREERLGNPSGIAFILKEPDIQYLVDKIWLRRSALSGVDDPRDLVLCRWSPDQPWSPWNCILLTEDEAKVHESIGVLQESYGAVFMQKVQHKQSLGKRHFNKLLNLGDKEE